ncbi:TPA: hypothetical protein MI968_06190 [Klebsiella pneumoniae MGH 78578]|uniref:Uncharacterized protein n=1 Tax=Klebsiella pneumoniae subsp. pneumoniae (strain ATCC 700721 / MGH 78578) TaxID=272620 RepID=A6T8A9_KLEP7|nr:hypothetical protein [Klebsiella pneumoniae]HBY9174459.1 hypothetical protein [Klebsiella pneumoniae MGH 78578]ABR76830.1 hypothetical protein KPN_01398 [Klebsiella pneumoniae subsp. pneumoniae MGH 78578]EIW8592183.1 hypothetical protein [Klebsiella pneumoniae]EIW8622103.1 hypothetical protein [Klebsiella pneumoniae]EIW9020114.1 hypothetical protein [Klebsiella pneumoniae]
MRSESDEYYDLVKRSTGEIVGSIRDAGRALVYTASGITSMRPLLEDEGIFNLNTMTSFLHRLGYRVIPPSDNMKSTA